MRLARAGEAVRRLSLWGRCGAIRGFRPQMAQMTQIL